jgi:hypothetical protein
MGDWDWGEGGWWECLTEKISSTSRSNLKPIQRRFEASTAPCSSGLWEACRLSDA